MGGLRVLVTGATGKQGGSVARQLIGRQHAVHALTRKPDSAAAQALAQLGARIVPGSLEDRAALERAMREVDAVFAMSTPFEAGTQAEERQGVTVADAAKAVGLQHLVYTSVASADQKTGIPHFDSKARVEAHIRSLAVPATVLAPAYFMENVVAFSLAQLKDGVTTPAGCTIDGIMEMEDGKVRSTLIKAVVKATERAKELISGD